jgi:glycosyltransferase involved in cell wall biosynthesis
MEKKNMNERVLLFLSKPPVPSIDGGCVALHSALLQWKYAGFEVHVFCLETPKHPLTQEGLEFLNQHCARFHSAFVNTNHFLAWIPSFFLKKLPLRAARFYRSNINKIWKNFLRSTDPHILVWEGLYSMVYFEKSTQPAKHIYRAHNIEHAIWREMKRNGILNWIVLLDNALLRRWEIKMLNSVDEILGISDEDCNYFSSKVDQVLIRHLPVGMQSQGVPGSFPPNPISLYHLGGMDWLPNREGMEHFLTKIWPHCLKRFPEIQLHLAGKHYPESWYHYEGVRIHGVHAGSAESFIENHHVLIVPIFSAGGVRIKILEAASLGRPVIATEKALSGLARSLEDCCFKVHRVEDWITALELLHKPGVLEQRSHDVYNAWKSNYGLKETAHWLVRWYKP